MLDDIFRLLCQSAACLVILVAVFLVLILLDRSWPAIRTVGLGFLLTPTGTPTPIRPCSAALAFVYGTV